MPTLHQHLAQKVQSWRDSNYACESFPAIAEILRFQVRDSGALRFLRSPQLRALETYWYLRLIEKTPHVFGMYQAAFGASKSSAIEALGVPMGAFQEADFDLDALWKRIREDEEFASKYKLDVLRESMTLTYASYIFALAMGAGKTILIGAIIATEFALANEYRDRDDAEFVQNALVFAPGKTILGALRQITHIPFDRILPARFYNAFQPQVKFTFTRDKEKDIPVVRESRFNVVITNIEKIRNRKETIKKGELGQLKISGIKEDEAKAELANLRLQTLASLPHLAIFSDEAHHTFGNEIGKDLKKVRLTVDYLATQTDLLCTVNTTGTPYAGREMLKDVVYWYGLSEGIRDGYLKDLSGNIKSYSFSSANASTFLRDAVTDFFEKYRDVKLPDGTPAKLAIFFPQTKDIAELRPELEIVLATLGVDASLVIEHTTEHDETAEFNDFRASAKRVALLVDRGVEGWDVPALFGCVLARKLKSNNFVLQAATRCLRQVAGNKLKASVYLSNDNTKMLNDALLENFGVTLDEIKKTPAQRHTLTLTVRKLDLAPIVVRQTFRSVHRVERPPAPLCFELPAIQNESISRETFTLAKADGLTPRADLGAAVLLARQNRLQNVLKRLGDAVSIEIENTLDARAVAVELCAVYRLELWEILDALRLIYPDDEIPLLHLPDLAAQVEKQVSNYQTQSEERDVSLALLHFGEDWGFKPTLQPDGTTLYTTEIAVPVGKSFDPLAPWEEADPLSQQISFHYSPYNFDSSLERDFFDRILEAAQTRRENVEDILFTGALTNPDQSDFWVWYRKENGSWGRYTPDFLIRLKDGRCLIIETKTSQNQSAVQEDFERVRAGQLPLTEEGRKAMALKAWETRAPGQFRYELFFGSSEVAANDLKTATDFLTAL